jgi:hypothetical protein
MKKGKRFLSNRLAYTLIIIGILIIVAVGVYAANSLLTPGVAPNPGHTISQTAPPSACSAGQVLQWTGASNADGGWVCVDLPSSQNPPKVSSVPIYQITNSICTGVGSMTLSSTCTPVACGVCGAGGYYWNSVYNCNGDGCQSCTSSVGCSNTAIGNLLYS